MPAGGSWNTSSPPIRAGAYFNFTAALQAAVNSGVTGVAAIIGTSDWGIVGAGREITSEGQYNAEFSTSTGGTLRDAVLGALDGMDGNGAGKVVALRAAASAKAKATLPLAGASASVLTLTAKYDGARANNFHATVQTNAVNASNKDIILYESGIELERFENITGGLVVNAAAVITAAASDYVTAAVTAGTGALTNIVGVAGGAGGFGTGGGGTAGNSGLSITSGDVVTALGVLNTTEFDSIALANITDDTTLDAFVAWNRDRNASGKRCFAVIGGAASEAIATALARTTEYDASATYGLGALNVIPLGFTDIRRLADDVVLSTAQLAPRIAGVQAATGWTRDLVGLKWTGYQVAVSTTQANYLDAINRGLVVFDNVRSDQVMIDTSCNALITTNTTDRHVAFREIRTVAIMHFIENTLSRVAKDMYVGSLANTATGRRDLVGSFLKFLKDLEEAGALEVGSSTVELDTAQQNTGDKMFLKYGIVPQGVVKRIFGNVQVGT